MATIVIDPSGAGKIGKISGGLKGNIKAIPKDNEVVVIMFIYGGIVASAHYSEYRKSDNSSFAGQEAVLDYIQANFKSASMSEEDIEAIVDYKISDKESLSNKKTTLTDNSNIYYPTQKAVKTAIDTKQNIITFGANKQIPFTNPTTNDFSYSNGLSFDDALKVSGANQSEVKRTGSSTNSTLNILNLLAKTSADMINGFGGSIDFNIEDSAGVSNLIGRIAAIRSGGADNSGRLAFYTGSGGSLTERMTILDNGFAGLGTDTPTKKLDVVGDIRAFGGVVQSQATSGGTLYMFTLNGIDGNGPKLQLGTSTAPGDFFEIGAWAAINHFSSKNRDLKLYTSSVSIYLKDSTGNVGINTTNPTEKLDVDGTIKSKFKTLSTDPTTSDIPTGYTMLVKNTTSGTLKLWANDGGTLKSVTLT